MKKLQEHEFKKIERHIGKHYGELRDLPLNSEKELLACLELYRDASKKSFHTTQQSVSTAEQS